MTRKSKRTFSETEYQLLLDNLSRVGGQVAPSTELSPPTSPAAGVAKPKKRQGVKEMPILQSLSQCSIRVEVSPTHVSLVFDGARLFTLNELFALLEYRKYVVFAYKKQWRELVARGLALAGDELPHFKTPCKVTLFRQGSKLVDRDSFSVMFKYIIDALKDEPKQSRRGIFPDDNPDIVFDDDKWQSLGDPIVGIRVDLIDPVPVIDRASRVNQLFNNPDQARQSSRALSSARTTDVKSKRSAR